MKKILALLLCLLFASTCLAEMPSPANPLKLEEVPEPNEGQHHYLLLVTDQWNYQKNAIGNTDGILLLTLDTRAKRVLLTGFSRDILVERPDGIMGRITFISKNHGPEALCEIMSRHFGVKIEKYILLDMNKVENIIDQMGGVDITVTNAEAGYLRRYAIPKDSTIPTMDKAGTYHFLGHSAVIYMRIRKVGNGDYGRNQRIRETLRSLAQIAMRYDAEQAFRLLDTIIANINKTNMSMQDLIQAATYALDLRGASIEQLRIPEDGVHKIINYAGMQVMDMDYEQARKSIAEFLGDSFVVIEE